MTTTRQPLIALGRDELTELHDRSRAEHADLVARGLALDLTRGKPSAAQLDLSNELQILSFHEHRKAVAAQEVVPA